MAFYGRAWREMQPLIDAVAADAGGLEARLRAIIPVKLEYFATNRAVLRALLRTGADPKHPLSPFGAETSDIRESDIAWSAGFSRRAAYACRAIWSLTCPARYGFSRWA
jgi:hypothetical protein